MLLHSPVTPRADQGSGSTAAHALDLSSANALRACLAPALRARDAVWLRLDGVGLDEPVTHGAFCRGLTSFGMGAPIAAPVPTTVVLDWSCMEACPAEGFALYSVVARRLARDGVRLVACDPSDASIAHVLQETQLATSLGWARVPCATAGRRSVDVIARPAQFGREPNESLDDFCDDLSAAVRRFQLRREVAGLATAATWEFVQNVLSHAEADHATAVALVLRRRRPPVLQIGIADDGVGIAGSITGQLRHRWLSWFSDASATEVVLQRTLSGRAATESAGAGGGMGNLVQRALREARASVHLRSGTAHIRLQPSAPDRYVRASLTYGAGTLVRLEVPLR